MKRTGSRFRAALALLVVLFLSGSVPLLLCEELRCVPSPSGEYLVLVYVYDQGGWGWGGRVFLGKWSLLPYPTIRWRYVDKADVAMDCRWQSGDTFQLTCQRLGKSVTHSTADFFPLREMLRSAGAYFTPDG